MCEGSYLFISAVLQTCFLFRLRNITEVLVLAAHSASCDDDFGEEYGRSIYFVIFPTAVPHMKYGHGRHTLPAVQHYDGYGGKYTRGERRGEKNKKYEDAMHTKSKLWRCKRWLWAKGGGI